MNNKSAAQKPVSAHYWLTLIAAVYLLAGCNAAEPPEHHKPAQGELATSLRLSSANVVEGKQVYYKYCAARHSVGRGPAPQLGDQPTWETLLSKGIGTLLDNTRNGINAMPAKGLCMGCSDRQLLAATSYLLTSSVNADRLPAQ